MILPSALRIERKSAFRDLAHQQAVTRLQLVQPRRERSFRHQLEEKLNLTFKRRRRNRIRTLRPLAVVLHPQRGVLSRNKLELPACLDAKHPQVSRKVHALGNSRLEKLVVRDHHEFKTSETRIRVKAENMGQ